MLRISEADIFEPAQSVRSLHVPRLAAIRSVQDDSARTDYPSEFGRNEVNTKKIFLCFERHAGPGDAAGDRAKDGAAIANGDACLLVDELDRVQAVAGA